MVRHGAPSQRPCRPSQACVVRFPMAWWVIRASHLPSRILVVRGPVQAGPSLGKMWAPRCEPIRHLGCMSDPSRGGACASRSPSIFLALPLDAFAFVVEVPVWSRSGELGSCGHPPRFAEAAGATLSLLRRTWC